MMIISNCCDCGSLVDTCLCFTCKNKCNDCDICEDGDMCVFACNQYKDEREDN